MIPILPSDKRSCLDTALASETFARPEQLRAFLQYICEMEMAGKGAELTEYQIGVHALGRSADYSPLEDSSVRTRAYELRQRLRKLYETELRDSEIRIELPRGSYLPHFAAGKLVAPEPEPVVVPVSPGLNHTRIPGWAWGTVAGALIASGLWWFPTRSPAAHQPSAVIREAWAPLQSPESDVSIFVAAPLHLLVSPYMSNAPGTLPKFPAPQELYTLFGRYRPLPADARLEMQPVQKAPQMGDVQAIARIVATLESLGTESHILPETNSPLPAMRIRSGILVGSPWYSRAASLLLEKTPWTMGLDPESREIGIVGQGPRAGSKYLPRRGPRGEYQEVFGLLTVLGRETAVEHPRTMIVISGLTSVGAHAAASFFSSAEAMTNLKARFEKDGAKSFPPSYQVVIRCRASDDAQLLSWEYEAHQTVGK